MLNKKIIFPSSVVLFVALVFVLPKSFIPIDLGSTILTVATFLFGIIGGFYIMVTTTDYNSVKSILATETAGWISLHQNLYIYDKKLAKKFSLMIDEYVRRAFDYEIINYAKGTKDEYGKLKNYIQELPVKNDLSSVHQNITGIMGSIVSARQQLTVLGTKTLSPFQWFVLMILGFFVIVSLYGVSSGEFFFDIVTIAISSSVILILFLIRDLDLYIWNEETFGYDIFENVLVSIDQLPYYPAESLVKDRVHPKYDTYRIGTLINPEKNFNRKIKIVNK